MAMTKLLFKFFLQLIVNFNTALLVDQILDQKHTADRKHGQADP